tara:strand:+ start:30 stop:1265 length:1236 start_codon:yes stop_codon:yes gene_type:complete
MKELRDYQVEKAKEAHGVLCKLGCVYISAEVRCGKTLMSLETARLYGAQCVLFLTKKNAISSIESDYKDFGYDKHFSMIVINDESMHKLQQLDFDLIIHDEHHRTGAFPKPGSKTKLFKKLFFGKPMIFLSGTPSPESFCQLYHQFWVTPNGPWTAYSNFYKWANLYVNKKEKRIGTHTVFDYSEGHKDMIMQAVEPYMVRFTQAQAGFSSSIDEEVLTVEMKPQTYAMCAKLLKDLVIQGKDEVILADSPVKLQQKLHQMYSGTIKFESGNRMVLDTSKAEFIQSYFLGQKLAIFYKFVAELDCLKQILGDKLTTDIDEFNSDPMKWYAVQIISGREGTSYAAADYLVFYNIDFSATSYWQGRDRMTTMDRQHNKVYWLFSRGGIEEKIYKAVKSKKTYTLSHFKKDFKT